MSTGCHRTQQGLTLVEIMVAIVITLILAAGIIQLFLGTSQTYRFQEALSRVQENGRFATEVLSRDIRMAGYWGCASADLAQVTNTLADPTGYPWNFSVAIEGFEASGSAWTPALDASITNAVTGSDIITLRSVQGRTFMVTDHASAPADIVVETGHDLAVNDVVLVSDCTSAAVFQITGVNTNNLVHGGGLGQTFRDGEVTRISTNTYYIRNGAGGQRALWRNGDELVEGVERMRITYGIDTNNDLRVDEYVGVTDIPTTGAGTPDWSTVVSVRIELLLVSLTDNVTGEPQFVQFAGEDIEPTDNRLRQVFSTTVGIRNRLP